MPNVIWGADALGQALAGLTLSEHRMKRLSADMLAADVPGAVRTEQSVSIEYIDGKAYGIREGDATEVTDANDEYNLRTTAAMARGAETAWNYLRRITDAFGQMGQNNLAVSGNKVFTAIEAAHASGVNSPGNRKAVAEAIKNHLSTLGAIATGIQNARNAAESDMGARIDEINSLLSQIADTNASIAAAAGDSAQPNLLRQRRVSLDKLGEYLPLQPPSTQGDFILQTAGGRTIVDGANAAKFLYTPTIDFSSFNPVYLRTIASDPTAVGVEGGQEALVIDVTGDFNAGASGSLAALIGFSRNQAASYASFLDAYAAGFRDSLNQIHNLGSAIAPRAALNGSPGFIGGAALTGDLAITAQGTLRVAVIDNATKNAVYSLDLDLGGAGGTVDSLTEAINGSGLGAYLTASVDPATGSFGLALNPAYANGFGIALGSLEGSPAPVVGVAGGAKTYGFGEFFHLNDLVSAPADFYRDGNSSGLASALALNPLIANDVGAAALALTRLRGDAVLGAVSQAVSSDPIGGRGLMDLFNRSKTDFPAIGSNSAYSGTFENFASTILQTIADMAATQKDETEALKEAHKQQAMAFSSEYGLSESEIATMSLRISRSQDLYFSFINNYFRMMRHVAEMGS